MKVLLTGAAGFIGMHCAQALAKRGDQVIGVDNLNDYYAVSLKQARLKQLESLANVRFTKLDVADRAAMRALFAREKPDAVIHLAAQAGVRYSIDHPDTYADSNIVGFLNVLEGCRHHDAKHLVYASSSSVYGGNDKVPFAEGDNVDHPVSLYAATKKANELMAYTYSHLFGLPTTGLRYFTVYGPWGRPDMSYWLFTDAIEAGRAIKVFNYGNMQRDFTYVDDVVAATLAALDRPPTRAAVSETDFAAAARPYRVYNIGNHAPVKLNDFIATIESALGKTAKKELLPIQPGDVLATYADTARAAADLGFAPRTSLADGIARFVAWYRDYHRGAAAPRSARA